MGNRTTRRREYVATVSQPMSDLIAAFTTVFLYNFAEASGVADNEGTSGSTYDMLEKGTHASVTGGDVSADTPLARQITGDTSPHDGFYVDPTTSFNAYDALTGAGHFTVAFKYTGTGTDDAGLVWAQGSGSFYQISLWLNSLSTGDGHLVYSYTDATTQQQLWTSATTGLDDGNWHIVTIRQPHDGSTGPRMIIDGVVDGGTPSIAGGHHDDWIGDLSANWITSAIGYRPFTDADGSTGGIDELQGLVELFYIADGDETEADIIAVHNAYLGI